MTLVRGLAVRISERVVQWAAPACKDWAKGLAREVEFIPTDWRALAWALGSLPILLDRRAAPNGVRLGVTFSLVAACASAANTAFDLFDLIHTLPALRTELIIMLPVWTLGTVIWTTRWRQYRAISRAVIGDPNLDRAAKIHRSEGG
jgi:hypothetical protein